MAHTTLPHSNPKKVYSLYILFFNIYFSRKFCCRIHLNYCTISKALEMWRGPKPGWWWMDNVGVRLILKKPPHRTTIRPHLSMAWTSGVPTPALVGQVGWEESCYWANIFIVQLGVPTQLDMNTLGGRLLWSKHPHSTAMGCYGLLWNKPLHIISQLCIPTLAKG